MDKSLRPAVIAGNWKMNKLRGEARALVEGILPALAKADCRVIACVPFTDLETVLEAARGSRLHIGAQNCHWAQSGAYTGEISAPMLAEMGVEYVILGHSERRQYFGETDATVNARLKAALASGLRVILCVGETLEQRQRGITAPVCSMQVRSALYEIPEAAMGDLLIAYEPVWAIGTGKTATAAQAGEVCGLIRDTVADLYSGRVAERLCIQYGGSMNPGNAAELLDQPDIDGGLIGGASLRAEEFVQIIQAASR